MFFFVFDDVCDGFFVIDVLEIYLFYVVCLGIKFYEIFLFVKGEEFYIYGVIIFVDGWWFLYNLFCVVNFSFNVMFYDEFFVSV